METRNTSASFTFKKAERLSSKKLIDELFTKGSSFSFYPFRVLFLEKQSASAEGVQVLISVPAKNFRRAVDRNKIRRLIREAYRLNKQPLHDSLIKKDKQVAVGLVYTAKTIEPFSVIQQNLIAALKKLIEEHG